MPDLRRTFVFSPILSHVYKTRPCNSSDEGPLFVSIPKHIISGLILWAPTSNSPRGENASRLVAHSMLHVPCPIYMSYGQLPSGYSTIRLILPSYWTSIGFNPSDRRQDYFKRQRCYRVCPMIL